MNATMSEIDQELGAALTTTAGIISLLDSMREREAYRELAGLMETISAIFMMYCEHPDWALPESFERTLSLLVNAQESRSWLLLADILRYEVTPLLQDWSKEFRNRADETARSHS